jgi:hypothetical protein
MLGSAAHLPEAYSPKCLEGVSLLKPYIEVGMVMMPKGGAAAYSDEQTERHHLHLITAVGAAYSGYTRSLNPEKTNRETMQPAHVSL